MRIFLVSDFLHAKPTVAPRTPMKRGGGAQTATEKEGKSEILFSRVDRKRVSVFSSKTNCKFGPLIKVETENQILFCRIE